MIRVVLTAVAVSTVTFLAGAPGPVGAEPPPTTIVDNEFIPRDRDLTECVSALPKPDCGSTSKGDWHQTAVMGVVACGLAFIGWRIVRSVRAKESEAADPGVQNR
jgi:hypothetical protein